MTVRRFDELPDDCGRLTAPDRRSSAVRLITALAAKRARLTARLQHAARRTVNP